MGVEPRYGGLIWNAVTTPPDVHLLDDIVWRALSGAHAHHSVGTEHVRRYARGFSPIVALRDRERPDFTAFDEFCALDEHFYCDGWSGPAPAGWNVESESAMAKMLWTSSDRVADELPEARRLSAVDGAQALALAALTQPGPFGPRTIELGEYFGVFDGARLIAMAGERMNAAPLREISGVCTHPDFQGRGLARRLVRKLIARQRGRGETPFLHVMSENAPARRLYARMGFEELRESVVRVIARS